MLPNNPNVAYNGFTFPASARSEINAEFVYDSADRTVVEVKYSLNIHCIIQNDAGTAATMLDLEQRLSKPGLKLT